MSLTPIHHLPYPDPEDAPDVPASIEALALAVEALLSTGEGAPVGTVVHTIGAVPPGWLACDGATYDSATYPALAAELGVASGNFTVPDLRDRFVMGAGAGPGLTARTVGEMAGTSGVHLNSAAMGAHAHTGTTGWMNQNAQHGHTLGQGVIGVYVFGIANSAVGPNYGLWADSGIGAGGGIGARGAHSHGINAQDLNHTHSFTTANAGGNGSPGGSNAHNNKSPYRAMTAIIKH